MNSKDIILSPEHGLCLVRIPEGARNIRLDMIDGAPRLAYLANELDDWMDVVPLPPGYTYELIGAYPGLSEEQAEGLVKSEALKYFGTDDIERITYMDYKANNYYFFSSIESFASLLESLGVEFRNMAVLKAVKN